MAEQKFNPASIDFTSLLPNVSTDLYKVPDTSLGTNQGNLFPSVNTDFSANTAPKSRDITGDFGSNVSSALQGFGSLANAFAAYKQYQLGKATLAQNRAAFNVNLANQAKITNAQIRDRALRRAAQRSDITGDLEAIQAAADKAAAPKLISGKSI